MHQEYIDIFRKLSTYIHLIREFKEYISNVHVRNSIEEHFGRTYCRVYININLKENSNKQYALYESVHKHFSYQKEYFSFYIGTDRYYKDDETNLNNKTEETHYNYIWNMLAWFVREDNITVNADLFISEWELRIEEKNRRQNDEEKRNKIESEVQNLTPQEGQLIAIKQWHNSPIRIGIAIKVTLPSRKHSFVMELAEVKKDLSVGKVIISHVFQRNIYAVMRPESLQRGTSKIDLIRQIENSDPFKGLIWRRPQDLWS